MPVAFRNACDDFMYTELLKERYAPKEEQPLTNSSNKKSSQNDSKSIRRKLRQTLNFSISYEVPLVSTKIKMVGHS